ncbi:MAG: hypothetical protein ABEI96_00390 [Haloarculaceae archaeon]
MFDTARTRLLAVAVLLCGHGVLFVLYAQQPVNPGAGVFPGEDELLQAPNRYVGDRVTVSGVVESTAPLVVRVDGRGGTARVTITDSGLSPDPGDTVRVYGVLTDPRTIRAVDAFAVPPSGLWYAWVVSFVAGLWTLGRLVRHWRVDASTLGFRPRDAPPSVEDLTGGGDRADD